MVGKLTKNLLGVCHVGAIFEVRVWSQLVSLIEQVGGILSQMFYE
jgi:hypothetical protein